MSETDCNGDGSEKSKTKQNKNAEDPNSKDESVGEKTPSGDKKSKLWKGIFGFLEKKGNKNKKGDLDVTENQPRYEALGQQGIASQDDTTSGTSEASDMCTNCKQTEDTEGIEKSEPPPVKSRPFSQPPSVGQRQGQASQINRQSNIKTSNEEENVYDVAVVDVDEGSDYLKAVIDSGVTLRTTCSYKGESRTDLDYTKGDVMILLREKDENGYYLVQHEKNKRRGLIHESRVIIINKYEDEPWFFYCKDRSEAENKLRQQGNEIGDFMIRPSTDGKNYALSILGNADNVLHYKIESGGKENYLFDFNNGTRKDFDSIPDIIRYFTDNRGLGVRLRKSIPKVSEN